MSKRTPPLILIIVILTLTSAGVATADHATGAPATNSTNKVEYFGLGHNSQDSLYRVPFGAVTPGTEVILRFRTLHDDVSSVTARLFSTAAGAEDFQEMERVARDVSCYDAEQPDASCDFWQTSVTPSETGLLYYRFIIRDGTAAAYYDDDRFQDGGWGEANPEPQDESYVITIYDPEFEPIGWMQDAVVYQIFPDRFRNGRGNNDPAADQPRYGYPPERFDQINLKPWDDLPEGYCRFYGDLDGTCDQIARGRDYFGGDLRGVQQKLNYLQALGVTVIYFNPLFEAASNHAYDTQDYYTIDHFFGSNDEFEQFIKEAEKRDIRVILDGVFNYVSSDSPYFDRYARFDTVGACESLDSPYRDWFFFQDVPPGTGTCTGSDGTAGAATYTTASDHDNLVIMDKERSGVRDLVYAADNAVARHWLELGASGWRLDEMRDPSTSAGFWSAFREAVKATQEDAPIVGDLWKKHETLERIQGDQADTAMNYRFRNAILGFFGIIDFKGFPDDGESGQLPSLFARKLNSIREDYPDAAYYTMLNLVGSHDTMRILWALTPGQDNREDKELNADNLARGTDLLRLATVIQYTIPGAPTVYYGDEVGVTGDDEPDNRRTFPWDDEGPYGVGGDTYLLQHYHKLAALRAANRVFRHGELEFLLTDDVNRTLAYLMRTQDEAAIVAINRDEIRQTLSLELSGRLPDGVMLGDALGTIGPVEAVEGVLSLSLPPLSAAVLLPTAGQDLAAPAAPGDLTATADGTDVHLDWTALRDAVAYRVYCSPVTGGGYQLIAEVDRPGYVNEGLRSGQTVHYVVTALDAAGNESANSNQASATPAD